jgi:hypothetical protein
LAENRIAEEEIGMNKRWHLTNEEKKKIRELTLKLVPQATIARRLNMDLRTLNRHQVWMRLAARPAIPEKRIMELFRKGWGGYRIARHLKIAVSAVYKIAHKNNFRRADGIGYPEPHGDVAAFIEAIKARQGYIKVLAKKYGVGFCAARRIAHEVLACPEFRPGACKPPLSSNFPQKSFDPKLATPDHFIEFVNRICNTCFNGKLPAIESSTFVSVMMTACGEILEGQPGPVIDSFAVGLTQAVNALRESQTARWKN